MLFSVIIPTYNRIDLLPRAISSVQAQSFADFELIVVDDGSTDGTREWLMSQASLLHVIAQPNGGQGSARNAGAAQAKGDYLAFLDSDDIWFPWTLQTFADLISLHRDPSILNGKFVEFADEKQLRACRQEDVRAEVFSDYFASALSGYFVGSGVAVLKRDLLLATGGYIVDRVNAEDHDLIFRMGTAPGFVQVTSPVTLGWRRHEKGLTKDSDRTYAGIMHMIRSERANAYPGGSSRSDARTKLITMHSRPASLSLLKAGSLANAWRLYWKTFRWNAMQQRWIYLAGFQLLALFSMFRRPVAN